MHIYAHKRVYRHCWLILHPAHIRAAVLLIAEIACNYLKSSNGRTPAKILWNLKTVSSHHKFFVFQSYENIFVLNRKWEKRIKSKKCIIGRGADKSRSRQLMASRPLWFININFHRPGTKTRARIVADLECILPSSATARELMLYAICASAVCRPLYVIV